MKNFFLLSNGKIGQEYNIVSMCKDIDIKTKTRLFELGFFCGEKIHIRATSITGGVLLIEIKGSMLTIRKREAGCVVVE